MASNTAPKARFTTSPAEAEPIDLATIAVWSQHPACRALYERHSALKHALAGIQAQRGAAWLAVRSTLNDESLSAVVARRHAQDTIADLEHQGAALEREMAQIAPQLAEAEVSAKAALQAHHAPIVAALEQAELDAMAALVAASAARAAAAKAATRACDRSLTIFGVFVDSTLAARLRMLRRLAARQARQQ